MERKRERNEAGKPNRLDESCRTTGENIRRLREELGWTQEELGGRCNMAAAHIGRIERGELNPKLKTLVSLAMAMGRDVGELVSRLTLREYRSLFDEEISKELEGMSVEMKDGLRQIIKTSISVLKEKEARGD